MAAARPTGPDVAHVLKLSPRCPTCGQTNVVTFQAFRAVVDPDRPFPPFVCTQCCPEPERPFDARAAAEATLLRAVSATLRAERQRDEAAEAEQTAG
jgi:transposase-like protein